MVLIASQAKSIYPRRRPFMEIVTKSLSVGQLLSFIDYNKFIIPEFQRPYSWTTKECEQLWGDLIELEQAKVENQNCPDYFFGTFIIYYDNFNQKELSIIDGQQRLTTLLLLLRAIYHHVDTLCQNAINPNAGLDQLKKTISSLLWAPQGLFNANIDINSPRLERRNYHNIDKFQDIMRSGMLGSIPDPNNQGATIELSDRRGLEIIFNELNKKNRSHLAKTSPLKEILSSNECINYAFFLNKLTNPLKAEGDIDKYIKLITLCFRLVILVPQDNANNPEVALSSALDIFDVLNNRGIQLTDSDVLKNKISVKVYPNRLEDFGKDWAKLVQALSGDESNSNCDEANSNERSSNNVFLTLDNIFRHYMNANRMKAKGGQKSKDSPLRDYFIKSSEGRELLGESKIIEILTQMTSFLTDALSNELDKDDSHELISNQVKYDFTILNKYKSLGTRWHYLISAFYLYSKDLAPSQFKAEFAQYIRYCTAALMLKSIVGKNSDADIPCLCEMIAIKRGLLDATKASFKAEISDNNNISDYNIKQLANQFVEIQAHIRNILSGKTDDLNHLVLLYAYAFRQTDYQPPHEQMNLFAQEPQGLLPITTIEHILPQKWNNNFGTQWEKIFNDLPSEERQQYQDATDFTNEYVEHLGNKIILDRERNIRASYNDFPAKIRAYKKQARNKPTIELNAFIRKYEAHPEWTKTDIDERTNKMIDVIIDYINNALNAGI